MKNSTEGLKKKVRGIFQNAEHGDQKEKWKHIDDSSRRANIHLIGVSDLE